VVTGPRLTPDNALIQGLHSSGIPGRRLARQDVVKHFPAGLPSFPLALTRSRTPSQRPRNRFGNDTPDKIAGRAGEQGERAGHGSNRTAGDTARRDLDDPVPPELPERRRFLLSQFSAELLFPSGIAGYAAFPRAWAASCCPSEGASLE